eukprot:CAMPEP_0201672446 /NCGR_PEP_ID=MMETSP0494-20130426/32223_1 /ASSEMBLY_ACC=CAM_ASM_000839 /TAXON_ID=420259 /ORGANISM="Thalassiosira gravida, Strain GMp14c1" /LENGTH=226 /DNA_ID=CAMNT_0048154077 /DNA_START=132 /DNA_END=812 /DNA_ORIENTATION=-
MSLSQFEKKLETTIVSQEQSNDEAKANAKNVTKAALFTLLHAISIAPKDVLSAEKRDQLDGTLTKHAPILKWPLMRSLSNPNHYRAFLGLPKTMEQTRRYLTVVSSAKLEEILIKDLDVSIIDNAQDIRWAEQVLSFMMGDGRRKKDLGGFTLRDKGPVRAALNKIESRRKELEEKSEVGKPITKKNNVQYEMDRDVRIVDAERQATRASGVASLVDDALQKNSKR